MDVITYRIENTQEQDHWFAYWDRILNPNHRGYVDEYRNHSAHGLTNHIREIYSDFAVQNNRAADVPKIPLEALRHLPSQLRVLKLAGYDIPGLPEDFGSLYPHIYYLEIERANLVYLPASIGNMTKLTHLYLPSNRLTGLPDTIARMDQLKRVSLDNNEFLREIPPPVLRLRAVQYIHVKNCGISDLSESILNVSPTLVSLDARDNRLGFHGARWNALSKMSVLTTLKLGNNTGIGSMPEELEGDFPRLRILKLRNMGIFRIPDNLFGISTLKKLDLSRNLFTEVPRDLGALDNLKFLNLVECPVLRELSPVVMHMGNLREVHMTVSAGSPLVTNLDGSPLSRMRAVRNARVLHHLYSTGILVLH